MIFSRSKSQFYLTLRRVYELKLASLRYHCFGGGVDSQQGQHPDVTRSYRVLDGSTVGNGGLELSEVVLGGRCSCSYLVGNIADAGLPGDGTFQTLVWMGVDMESKRWRW